MKTSIKLSDALWERLKILAFKEKKTLSQVVEELILKALEEKQETVRVEEAGTGKQENIKDYDL
ncbi:MAG: hypothetical protein ACPLRS_02580 [Hydrogenobacter sp.]